MAKIPASYQGPVGLAVILHVALLVVLIVHDPKTAAFRTPVAASQTQVVKAVAVDSQAVHEQVQKIQAAQDQKKAAELARVKRLQQQAVAAKRRRVAEEKRLADLKARQLREHKARVARQKALAEKKAQEKKAQEKKAKALAKARETKRLAEKRAKEKAAALAAEKKRKAAELALQQKQLQDKLMAQQIEAERQSLAKAKALEMQGLIDRYKGQILQAIQQQWILPDDSDDKKSCVFLIHLGPGGAVISVTLVRSSGDAVLDRSAKVAVFKASPLPVPEDPKLFDPFRELRLTVRPERIAG